MEKVAMVPADSFVSDWNGFFPDMPLQTVDLKRPQLVMNALLHLFDRLGVSKEALLMGPAESDEHYIYYRDLLPFVNSIRIINHLVSLIPEANLSINIMHLLQPTTSRSFIILMVLFNQMVFYEARLEDIAPSEEELFAYKEKVKSLMEKKDSLIEMRNMEAQEKGDRVERLKQLEHDIPLLEEEVKKEKKIESELVQELEALTEENKQTDALLEKKKASRDGILAENARKKALKVYDADDIRGQAAQAAANVREAEDTLGALSGTLALKEACLHNLQATRPALDQANQLLHDLARLADCLKDFESGDLDSDGAEGELGALESERAELSAALGEARAAAAGALQRRRRGAAAHARAARDTESALREAEEKHKRSMEEAERARSAVDGLKRDSARWEQDRATGRAELEGIKQRAERALTAMQDNLINKLKDVGRKIEEQNQRRRKL